MRLLKKYWLVWLAAVFFVSCSTQAPTEEEVKQMVQLWYMQESSAEGAGRWEVGGITVLSVKNDEDRKDVFNTLSHVTGTRHFPPLAEPRPSAPFSDTLRMDLRWNGAKWVTAE